MKRLVLLTLIMAVCCKGPEQRSETEAASPQSGQAAGSGTPAPLPEENAAVPAQEIWIDSIEIANPLTVKGRARTFENAVSLRVRDSSGAIVAEEHVTSRGEMGRHNPYEAQLWITRDPGASVTVEAFEFSARDGSVQSLTSRSAGYDIDRIRATLIFPVGDCTRLDAFARDVPKSVAMARLLVEALLAGPIAVETAAGASSPFPEGSDVLAVTLRDGEVTVDFNERLQNVGGSCAALAIRDSVTRTLMELPTVKRVAIRAGGSESLALQP